nr:hypothetical protein [Millisia brevis]
MRRRVIQVVFVVAAAATCLVLGWWQLQRYESTSGTGQNLGYALQWPLFAAFVVFAYRRFLQLEEDPTEPTRVDGPTEIPAGVLPTRPTVAPPVEPDPEDGALVEYNAYLAQLDASERPAGPLRANERASTAVADPPDTAPGRDSDHSDHRSQQ